MSFDVARGFSPRHERRRRSTAILQRPGRTADLKVVCMDGDDIPTAAMVFPSRRRPRRGRDPERPVRAPCRLSLRPEEHRCCGRLHGSPRRENADTVWLAKISSDHREPIRRRTPRFPVFSRDDQVEPTPGIAILPYAELLKAAVSAAWELLSPSGLRPVNVQRPLDCRFSMKAAVAWKIGASSIHFVCIT
jgi:hypothetical protein